jgi:hypothetical protein
MSSTQPACSGSAATYVAVLCSRYRALRRRALGRPSRLIISKSGYASCSSDVSKRTAVRVQSIRTAARHVLKNDTRRQTRRWFLVQSMSHNLSRTAGRVQAMGYPVAWSTGASSSTRCSAHTDVPSISKYATLRCAHHPMHHVFVLVLKKAGRLELS